MTPGEQDIVTAAAHAIRERHITHNDTFSRGYRWGTASHGGVKFFKVYIEGVTLPNTSLWQLAHCKITDTWVVHDVQQERNYMLVAVMDQLGITNPIVLDEATWTNLLSKYDPTKGGFTGWLIGAYGMNAP